MSNQDSTPDRAAEAMEFLHAAQNVAANAGDYDSARILQTEAIARAILAVADAINANGATERMQQQLKSNAEAFRVEIERGLKTNAEAVGLNPNPTDQDVEELAADLWKADPANEGNPAREFAHDYANKQDAYLKMARAALGISEEPRRKDSRRP